MTTKQPRLDVDFGDLLPVIEAISNATGASRASVVRDLVRRGLQQHDAIRQAVRDAVIGLATQPENLSVLAQFIGYPAAQGVQDALRKEDQDVA
jgi:metal-responsive CopG/Arc/MetJ family transcriptional regulator